MKIENGHSFIWVKGYFREHFCLILWFPFDVGCGLWKVKGHTFIYSHMGSDTFEWWYLPIWVPHSLSFPFQFQPLTPFLILIFVTFKILDDLWDCDDTLVCVLAWFEFEIWVCLPHKQHAFEAGVQFSDQKKKARVQRSNMDVDILFDNKALVCCYS